MSLNIKPTQSFVQLLKLRKVLSESILKESIEFSRYLGFNLYYMDKYGMMVVVYDKYGKQAQMALCFKLNT